MTAVRIPRPGPIKSALIVLALLVLAAVLLPLAIAIGLVLVLLALVLGLVARLRALRADDSGGRGRVNVRVHRPNGDLTRR